VNAKYGKECGIFIANNTVRGGKLKENNFAFRGSIDAMSTVAEAKRRRIRKEKVKKIEVARKKKKMERNKLR
jgi:hypothetical protein